VGSGDRDARRQPHGDDEVHRFERLWSSDFGDAYLERNRAAGAGRERFFAHVISRCQPRRVLEVGCGHAVNLPYFTGAVPARNVWGVDINEASLAAARRDIPDVNVGWSPARSLPFRDGWFDLVYTVAVLMHQPDTTLPIVMQEIVRCSRRWIMCAEYYADERSEVEWRAPGALIKRNFTELYLAHFPELRLVEEGFLDKEDGFDRVNFAVFEKTGDDAAAWEHEPPNAT